MRELTGVSWSVRSDSHTIYTAKPFRDPRDGSVQVYYSGGNGPHSGVRADCIGLARFRTDGFAGWKADAAGTVRTRPLNCTTAQLRGLRLNADVQPSGRVEVLALAADGSTVAQSQALTRSVSDGLVPWSGAVAAPNESLASQSLAFEFRLAGATVFSLVLLA